MARNVIIVNATQVVTSETHPEGLFSVMSGFPKNFDSNGYNGDIELTMKKAKATYFDQRGKNYDDTNPTRVMTTVTLEVANGQQILHESIGSFPVEAEPAPMLEPEEEESTEGE